MAKNLQTNLHDLQPNDIFQDRKLKGILLLITQGIQHNVMRSQHMLLEHAHVR